MKEYGNYIFDLYGTLVEIHTDENRRSFWKQMEAVFEEHQVSIEGNKLQKLYLEKVNELEEEQKEEGHRIEIELKDVFKDLLGCEDEKVIEEVMLRFREASTDHIRLYAGAKELLSMLREKGKKVFLLSNAQEVFTMMELERFGLLPYFDDILLSSMAGYKKPDPHFFEILLQRQHLKKEECLMIGNDMECDINGAKEAGIDAAYIHSRLSPKKKIIRDPVYAQDHMDLFLLKREIERSFV